MTREERTKEFLERTDTAWAKRRMVAKKVAALLAESAATMPEVEAIFDLAKHYLAVTVKHTCDQPKVLTDGSFDDLLQRARVTDTVSVSSMETLPKLVKEISFCSQKQQAIQNHRRRIMANGIRFGGTQFQNPNMLNHLLEKMDVIPISEKEIKVLTSCGELIFKAYPSSL